MAQKAYSIESGNLQSRSIITTRNKVYKDLDLTFARAPNNDVFKKTDAAAVKQSVKNILLTNRLEKPCNPIFGGNLNSFLFELSEFFDEQTIEDEVKTAIENYEPRARIRGVRAKIIPDRNDIRVTVAFQIVNTLEDVTLEVSLARLR
jgi:phage baseplate assembly protein W